MLFKLKTKIKRFLNGLLETQRPASHPYLSGDGFRAVANFVYDQFLDFDPAGVKYGDIVFVRNNYLPEFFGKVHPSIKEPYVLLSHNEDRTVGPEFIDDIDDKILHWYAQNLSFKHPKATLLPIGVQNFTVGPLEDFIHAFPAMKPDRSSKKDRILFGFTVGHYRDNGGRNELHRILSECKVADHVTEPRLAYYKTLGRYKFVVSPGGGGLDCHRTWEALYFKVIPILLRNDFSEQLLDMGFPILIVDSWADILELSSEDLRRYYEKREDSFATPKLHLNYWYSTFSGHRLSR